MAGSGNIREGVLAHLTAAAFETRVAAGFECIKGTPAHANLQAALAKIAEARAWVIANIAAEQGTAKPRPVSESLPLTRKARLSYSHLRFP